MELYFNDGTHYYQLHWYGARILDVEPILPTPEYKFIDIEGRKELIDLSTINGEMSYKKDWRFIITFDIKESAAESVNISELARILHGKKYTFTIGEKKTTESKEYTGYFKINKITRENVLYAIYELEITVIQGEL